MRIPTRVVLPFGYRITVRQLTDAEMDRRDNNADGIWDADSKTIYIRKRLPVTRRRYILAHELGIASLLSVDPRTNRITTDICWMKFDKLIIATGATTNYFNMPGVRDHALSMKSVSDAIFIRNAILQNYESALNETEAEKIQSFLTVVIVGGGPTGVELAGALAEMKRYILPKDYPELDFSQMKIFLFEAGHALLGGMSGKSSEQVWKYLKRLGIRVKLNTLVKNYDGKEVLLENGIRHRTHT